MILLKIPPFTWFDKLTTGFDKLVLSEVEGLKANGECIENIDGFSVHAEPACPERSRRVEA